MGEPKDIENTVSDSEETKVKDEKQKERISAMNSLESYCSNMKSTVEDEKFKDKISDSDKETVTKKCDETIKWMETNQLAEVDEFQDQQKAVEGVCNPIINKLMVLKACQAICLKKCLVLMNLLVNLEVPLL